jgi:hypothetical protein
MYHCVDWYIMANISEELHQADSFQKILVAMRTSKFFTLV